MRNALRLLAFALALSSLVACNRFDVANDIRPLPEFPLIEKGSGNPCADVSGSYACSATEEERADGKTLYSLQLQQGKNPAGQDVLKVEQLEYVADGEIYEYTAKSGVIVKYSVNCNANSVVLHTVGSGGQDAKSEFKKTSESELAFSIAARVKDGAKTESRLCKKL